jgi:hypothetical protein
LQLVQKSISNCTTFLGVCGLLHNETDSVLIMGGV